MTNMRIFREKGSTLPIKLEVLYDKIEIAGVGRDAVNLHITFHTM